MKKQKKTRLSFTKTTVIELNEKKLLNIKGGQGDGNDPNTVTVTDSRGCIPQAGGSTLVCG